MTVSACVDIHELFRDSANIRNPLALLPHVWRVPNSNPGISDLLVILKFLNNFLNTIRRIQQSADGGVVIQLVDDESDIFAQVAADVIFAGEKLRCLVYDVGGQNFCEESLLIRLVDFLQSAGEQSEGRAHVDVACLTIL